MLHEDTNFESVIWPKVSKDRYTAAVHVRIYERLRLLMTQQNKFRAQHFFLRKEMRCQEIVDGIYLSFPSRFFRVFSNYGWSYTSASLSIFLLIIVGWLCFSIIICQTHLTSENDSWMNCSLPLLGASFSNTFYFLGFNRSFFAEEFVIISMHSTAVFYSIVQAIIGSIFIFFLLLSFRNRFRMR